MQASKHFDTLKYYFDQYSLIAYQPPLLAVSKSGCAQLEWIKNRYVITNLTANVNPLDICSSEKNNYKIISGLAAQEVLIRPLEIKLTKEKEIDAVLEFQAEPLLTIPIENLIIEKQTALKTKESTLVTLFCAKKDHIAKHLEQLEQLGFNPEIVSCSQIALWGLSSRFGPSSATYFSVFFGEDETVVALIKDRKLIAGNSSTFTYQTPYENFSAQVSKMLFALSKQHRDFDLNEVFVCGPGALDKPFIQKIFSPFRYAVTYPSPENVSEKDFHTFALPLGLAYASTIDPIINFRKKEFFYPSPLKNFKKPILHFFSLAFLFSLSLYLLGEAYLSYQEMGIKQEYVELLNGFHKTYEQFETEFASKANRDEEIVPIEDLSKEGIAERVYFLEKQVQLTPDIFPLFPNIPRVSDVLAWLCTHPNIVKKENDSLIPLIQIENFSYTMVKRPDFSKKNEKYQVKIDLEFTSETPKLARELHDALITPNGFVDTKEVKWNSSRGKYRTSFYLKDKTQYPGV